jgi:DNA-binding transcriptional LysR family regulator
MELKHLTSFIAVAEQLSFVRAADRLYLSQPALTGQIQRLEEELGVQLLARNRRSVKLTDAGKVFLVEARATLSRARQAADRAQKAARGEIGRLRIGFVSSAALEIVPSIVVAFRKQHPEVTLDLMNLRTVSQVKKLISKNLDIGFLRLPLSNEQLRTTVVHKQVQIAHLRDERFVAYGRRWAPGFFDSVIQMCLKEGFSPNIVQETGEMYTAIALIAAGAGIAILPRSVVLAQSKNIVMKPLAGKVPVSEIAIATRAGNSSLIVRSFIELAAEKCGDSL